MKTILESTSRLLALSLLLWASPLLAQDWTTYRAEPGASKVLIEGDSSIHEWAMEGSLIGGLLEIAPGIKLDPKESAALTDKTDFLKADVIIPVTSLKSGKATMDEVMQQAMNVAKHPRIRYTLKKIKLDTNAESTAEELAMESTGDLTINGVTKSVVLPVRITLLDGGKLKVSGKTAMKMTEYDVKPPSPKFVGAFIKTDDDITISFDWVVKKK